MRMHLVPLSEERMFLIVQVGKEVIVELLKIEELTQRIMNYMSIVQFSSEVY